jgi:chemotaxis response regulator CheB
VFRTRLLVIDDSATVRAIVEQLFERDGVFEIVGVAASIESARHLLVALRPNLITLDLHLPGVGGLEFLDELKGYSHRPVVIVLSSSTHANSSETREALAKGADACFDKNLLLSDSKRFLKTTTKLMNRHHRNEISSRQKSPGMALDV